MLQLLMCSAAGHHTAAVLDFVGPANWLYVSACKQLCAASAAHHGKRTRLCIDSTATLQWALEVGGYKHWLHCDLVAIAAKGSILLLQFTCSRGACLNDVAVVCAAATSGSLPCIEFLCTAVRCSPEAQAAAACAAAAAGHLAIVQRLFRHAGCLSQALDAAAAHGQLHIVQHYAQYHNRSTPAAAAAHGHVEILQYLFYRAGWGIETNVAVAAAGANQLPAMQFLRAVGAPITALALARAAQRGHLDMVQYLHTEHCPRDKTQAWAAAMAGHVDVLNFLLQAGYPADQVLVGAVRGKVSDKQVQVLQCAMSHGLQPDADLLVMAAQEGGLACLQFLREQVGVLWDERAASAAASTGSIAVLDYLRTHHAPWGPSAYCSAIVGCADPSILRYLHRHQCPLSAQVTSTAALQNKLTLLCVLHEELHCPWEEAACVMAAQYGHRRVLEYARQAGCPCGVATTQAAARRGDLALFSWLHRTGCPWNAEVLHTAASYGHTDLVQYAHERGCPSCPDTLMAHLHTFSEDVADYVADNMLW